MHKTAIARVKLQPQTLLFDTWGYPSRCWPTARARLHLIIAKSCEGFTFRSRGRPMVRDEIARSARWELAVTESSVVTSKLPAGRWFYTGKWWSSSKLPRRLAQHNLQGILRCPKGSWECRWLHANCGQPRAIDGASPEGSDQQQMAPMP